MKKEKAPWRNRFLNVIERSIIELNIEYNNYSIGQIANGESKKRIFDDTVQGIEFADELTVCSAIVNDCLSSPIFSGDIDVNDQGAKEIKFYKIQREVRYENDDKARADITIQRVDLKDILDNPNVSKRDKHEVSFIEAKRAKQYSNSTLDKSVSKSGSITKSKFKAETQKRIAKYSLRNRFLYVLIWGVWNKTNEKSNTPENYLKSFCKNTSFEIKKENLKIRWIPLSWSIKDTISPPTTSHVVKKWCWVILGQITTK